MTPGGWLAVLEPRLDAQARACQRYRDYYDGKHRLLFATAKFRQAFGGLFSELADNWCPIVVDAAVERMAVMGFRFGGDSADRDAWAIWQANRLDAESIQAFTEAIKCGCAYLLVSPPDGDGAPGVSVEHPQQMVAVYAKGDRSRRLAALKRWLDDDGYAYATLYLPDVLVKWRSQKLLRQHTSGARIDWQLRRDDPGGRNPIGEVPVVPLENNPDMLTGGTSDLATAIPLQDAVNKLCTDMLVASEFNAYPQRWATGLQVPTIGETDVPDTAALLKASQGHVWISDDGNTRFGQLAAGDLNNYVTGMETLIQHLAAQTRTPPHYLLAKMVNLSGDALKAAETGLVARVKRKHIDFSDSLEEAMRLAFRAVGDTDRAGTLDAETIWRDPESRAPGVIADSLVKKRQIGVPLEVLWEEAGYSPQQIERMKRLANLPDRPPPGATTADVSLPGDVTVPPLLGGP
jgi:hypothetical protein